MNKNSLYLIIILFSVSILFSCNSNSSKIDQNYVNKEESVQTPDAQDNYDATSKDRKDIDQQKSTPNTDALSDDEISKIGKKIIKNGQISLQVDDYSKAVKIIKDTLNAFDCYIANESESKYGSSISNQLTIRVKSNQFDKLLKAILSGKGTVSSKTISVNDVTEDYVDVYQRLKTKKLVLSQYEEYLKKAYTINDILNVTNYMRQIQEEIEVAEGRLKYMDNQSDFSTIILNITQNPTEVVENSFWNQLIKGLSVGWHGFLYVILAIFYLWPLWILLVIIIFVVRSIKKKKTKKITND